MRERAPAPIGRAERAPLGGLVLLRMLGAHILTRTRASPRSVSGPAPRSGRPAPRHDGALLRPPGHHLHHLLGPHRHRRALVRAERTQPRGDHHHAGSHRCVLLPLLAHRHPGPAEPPVRAAAEERDHLVRALPLGVTAAASAEVPQLSG